MLQTDNDSDFDSTVRSCLVSSAGLISGGANTSIINWKILRSYYFNVISKISPKLFCAEDATKKTASSLEAVLNFVKSQPFLQQLGDSFSIVGYFEGATVG
ncbi:hypothetical protein Enr17x_17550 [Gimesia fumaroli]|uniref:Uncharacterized protein n=1 Tax=Gimesia fumaroli TaxID=2527976 RepID=A0A518I9K6_9PLAN|nr:hypothetical protein Enr17x_17550 [Gimesia fumaroli]